MSKLLKTPLKKLQIQKKEKKNHLFLAKILGIRRMAN
jgi:hypothetical protein